MVVNPPCCICSERSKAWRVDSSPLLGGMAPCYAFTSFLANKVRGVLIKLEPLERLNMSETRISSATKEVVIGFDRPFVIIGERINPTGRKKLAEEMKNGDFSRVERDAVAQVAAGAHMLDVNAGIPLADEPAILAKTVQLVQSLVDVPLSIDSSIIEALRQALQSIKAKPW